MKLADIIGKGSTLLLSLRILKIFCEKRDLAIRNRSKLNLANKKAGVQL